MYCGSCLHGNTLAAALHAGGGDVLLVPLYTPLRTDEESVAEERVAFGGINVHLQQHWGLFRHTPWWWTACWTAPPCSAGQAAAGPGPGRSRPARWPSPCSAARKAGTQGTRKAARLAGVGGQARRGPPLHGVALRRGPATPWAAARAGGRHALGRGRFSGETAAAALRRRPPRAAARAAELDALVAMNAYYADFMAEYLAVPRGAHPRHSAGIEPPGPRPPAVDAAGRPALHHRLPRADLPGKRAAPTPRCLEAAGRGCGRAAHWGPRGRVSRPAGPPLPGRTCGRPGLLRSGRAVRVRGRVGPRGEDRFPAFARRVQRAQHLPQSKGLSVFEAWANGVPAVLPAHGAFPEMVADTGGGLPRPGDAAALAAALKQMIDQSELAAECGRRAQEAVHHRYHARRMAEDTMNLYNQLLENPHVLPRRTDAAMGTHGGPAGRASVAGTALAGRRPARGRRFRRPPRSSNVYYTGFALRGLAMLGQLTAGAACRAGEFLPRGADADRLPGPTSSRCWPARRWNGRRRQRLARAGRDRRQMVLRHFGPLRRRTAAMPRPPAGHQGSLYQTFLACCAGNGRPAAARTRRQSSCWPSRRRGGRRFRGIGAPSTGRHEPHGRRGGTAAVSARWTKRCGRGPVPGRHADARRAGCGPSPAAAGRPVEHLQRLCGAGRPGRRRRDRPGCGGAFARGLEQPRGRLPCRRPGTARPTSSTRFYGLGVAALGGRSG